MSDDAGHWRPGSFTKNFSWGEVSGGFVRLHECIRAGFANEMADVPRQVFRQRVSDFNRPDFIPINFFLFNRTVDSVDYLVADELVFQALNFGHSLRFDRLAVFAFNFSYAGRFSGANPEQRRPALWAHHYIRDRVSGDISWKIRDFSAEEITDDIHRFLKNDSRYKAKTSRKVATNLSYLYQLGRLTEFYESSLERWWVDSLFLALDRLIDDRKLDGLTTADGQLTTLLRQSGFSELTGRKTLERSLAINHIINLYVACGGRDRFSDEFVKQRTELVLSEFNWPNDDRPQGAIHPTNARILKSIPRICAMLAKDAGFDIVDFDEMEHFNLDDFIQRHTRDALDRLRTKGIEPTMTAAELIRLTRDK